MNRYESNLKAISPALSELKNQFSKMPKGVFDETHQVIFDCSEGYIIPFDYYELVPFSKLFLNYDISLLSHNPTFRRLLSGADIEVRVYKRDKRHSWQHWDNFITRGRKGDDNSTIPYLNFNLGKYNGNDILTCTPHSPASYMGLLPPILFGSLWDEPYVKSRFPQIYCGTYAQDISSLLTGLSGSISRVSSLSRDTMLSSLRISAFPFVIYESVCKEFVNWNLLQNNPNLIKSNEMHQDVLPFDVVGGYVTTSNYDNPNPDSDLVGGFEYYNNDSTQPFLNVLRRSDKRGDMFDTGSPFPDLLRGDVPTLDLFNSDSAIGTLDFSDSVASLATGLDSQIFVGVGGHSFDDALFTAGHLITPAQGSTASIMGDTTSVNAFKDALNKGKISADVLRGLQFSMAQWRQLATLTVFRERMARCDGSYNSLIEAQFGRNPHVDTPRPVFCGGFRQPIAFSEVVQQSASDVTPLGTTAGRSVSVEQHPTIEVSSDDYCDVISVLVIRSEEYYSQGVDKLASRLTQSEQYFPIMNNLSPDATKNKELYISGSDDIDEDVFNYVERFSYYKSRRNRVCGLMSLPYSSGAGSITQYVKHRIFTSTPQFNSDFMQDTEDSNMKSVYTSSQESEFVLRVACSDKLIAPIPDVSVPSDMGISY